MKKVMMTAAAAAVLATSVQAKPNLRDVSAIDDGLLAVALANEIRNKCANISPRMLKALRFVNGLRDKARNMGYSDTEIDAYRKSDVEKERLKAKGYAYLEANGVINGQPETYCALGRAEIEKSSQIGALLKVN
ncbi:DUF5333 family protein [Pseudosulfitobacter sp. SM2401]|uniref:DUF5333 domain-containing protein n=1 Tax=Pseudosulfitobacter sp. SM2401 TaxID=3350098 RepID=UPI0036F44994